MVKIVVLVSGSGTNLQAILDFERENQNCPYKVVAVISDTKKAFALERAKNAGLPAEVASPYSILGEKAKSASREQKRLCVSDQVLALAKKFEAQAIILAGYLTVLSGQILNEFNEKIINLHPALLPKFGGEGMWGHFVHEAVLKSGEKESGCTIHLVNSGCDTGKILLQKKVPVLKDDTAETLAKRISVQEHKAIVEGICILCDSIEKSKTQNA